MATFGKTTNGAGENQDGGSVIRGCRFRLFELASITALTMRARVNAPGTVKAKMAIYSDVAGSPVHVVATSAEISFTNTSDAEITGAVSPTTLQPGYYWIMFTNDGGTGGGGLWFREDAFTNGDQVAANTYPTFTDPWVLSGTQNFLITVYATYTKLSNVVVCSPVAGANSPVDGYTTRFGVDQSFAAIRAGAGTVTSNTDSSLIAQLRSSTTSNQFSQLYRVIMCFNTAIPVGQTVISAVLSIAGNTKNNNIGSPDLYICGATPGSTAALTNADYNQLQTVSFGSTTYAGFATDLTYTDITLNPAGIAAISTTGITSLGAVLSWDINASFTGVWSSDVVSNFGWASADGNYAPPVLTVTYAAPGGGFLMNFV